MPDVEFVNLLGVLVVALVAPLLLGFVPRVRVPAVVLEIVLGIVVGPSVLGWLEPDLAAQIVGLLGLAMLLFLAGLEIDVHQLRGRLLGYSVIGYLLSILIGWGSGAVLSSAGWLDDPLLLAVTVSATSLGLVVAVLKDAGAVEGRLGQTTIAASSVADFAAVLLLSLVFSATGGAPGSRVLLLVLFVALVVTVGVAVSLSARSMRLGDVLVRLQDTTAEIRVRGAMVLLMAFVVFAEKFGLESILGAFMAGAAVGLVDRDGASHPHFRIKLEAIGYGFLIPVFFVSSGLRLDVGGLFASGAALARVPPWPGCRSSCWCCSWPADCPRCSTCAGSDHVVRRPRHCSRRPPCRSSSRRPRSASSPDGSSRRPQPGWSARDWSRCCSSRRPPRPWGLVSRGRSATRRPRAGPRVRCPPLHRARSLSSSGRDAPASAPGRPRSPG